MAVYDRIKGVSRRDFFRVAGTYGLSSTMLAAGAFGGAMTAGNLAAAGLKHRCRNTPSDRSCRRYDPSKPLH